MADAAAFFLQPYTLLVLATGLGLAVTWRGRPEARSRLLLAVGPYTLLFVFSLPVSGYLALGSLEWRDSSPLYEPTDAQAVVVLAGNISPASGVRRKAELGHSTLYRCVHAAELYRKLGPIPVVVCGGRPTPSDGGPAEAEVMRDFLVGMGVKPSDVILEPNSRTTFENAAEAGKILRRKGGRKVILVTEASHMPRALLCFRGQGLDASPSACRFRATRFQPSLYGFVPTIGGEGGLDVSHEWLGLAWYWLKGLV